MNKRVIVAQKMTATEGDFGRNSGGVRYERVGEFWAAIDFSRGTKALREGAMDAYDTLMVRMRYNKNVTRESLIAHGGRCYEILSFNEEYEANTLQMTVRELPDKSTDFYKALSQAQNGEAVNP